MIVPKIFWCYCILILQVMCRDSPTVKIPKQGTIMGMFMKMYRTQSIVAYLGVPYAQPPVGNLRFSPPVVDNLPSWEGNRNGSMAQPNCYQNTKMPKQKHTMVLNKLLNKVMDMDAMMKEMSSDQYDEDCLYLNIFVPDGEFQHFLQVSNRFLARFLSNGDDWGVSSQVWLMNRDVKMARECKRNGCVNSTSVVNQVTRLITRNDSPDDETTNFFDVTKTDPSGSLTTAKFPYFTIYETLKCLYIK